MPEVLLPEVHHVVQEPGPLRRLLSLLARTVAVGVVAAALVGTPEPRYPGWRYRAVSCLWLLQHVSVLQTSMLHLLWFFEVSERELASWCFRARVF